MIQPILRYSDDVLHQRADAVGDITMEINRIIEDMIETMYGATGVGLAAPQIGVPLQIFVADLSDGRNLNDLIVMINPELVERDGLQQEEEGCLSVPGFNATVQRPARVVVRGLGRDGVEHELEGSGLLARVFQHELDHLDGTLFLDRLRRIKREMIIRKINKLKRTGKW